VKFLVNQIRKQDYNSLFNSVETKQILQLRQFERCVCCVELNWESQLILGWTVTQ